MNQLQFKDWILNYVAIMSTFIFDSSIQYIEFYVPKLENFYHSSQAYVLTGV